MGDVAGTLRKVTLAGVTYDVFPDTNVSATPNRYENTPLPTSGRTMQKKTVRAQSREGISLACNASEQTNLRDLADSLSSFPMSYETAAGDVWSTVGFISFESHETEENKANIQMHEDREWRLFVAS